MALPGAMVYCMGRYATGLHGPLVSGACGASIRENREPGKIVPTMDSDASDVSDALNPRISGVSTDVLLLSECGHALVHHYRVFT